MVERFLSCDWGTSRLRLRLADARTGEVLGEVASEEGIRAAHRAWQEQGGDRFAAFQRILDRHLGALEARVGGATDAAVLVISGMASSSLGIRELPYAGLPFPLDGSGLRYEELDGSLRRGLRSFLLSGVRSDHDVMRGEEVQLLGLWQDVRPASGSAVFVLPGTHSKHVHVRGGRVVDFRTSMTGELFEVASTHTVLAASVARADFAEAGEAAFRAGVRTSVDEPLLHALFRVRTNVVLQNLPMESNFWFLSGLLIGAELGALADSGDAPLYLCAGEGLQRQYRTALEELGLGERTVVVEQGRVERSPVAGHLAFVRRVLLARDDFQQPTAGA